MIKFKFDELVGKLFIINYWLICVEEGNDLKIGIILEFKDDLYFVSKEGVLVINIVGGMNK